MGISQAVHHLRNRLSEICLIQTCAEFTQLFAKLPAVVILQLVEHVLNLYEPEEKAFRRVNKRLNIIAKSLR